MERAYTTNPVGCVRAVVDPATRDVVAFLGASGRLVARRDAEGTEAYARASARWGVDGALEPSDFYRALNSAL